MDENTKQHCLPLFDLNLLTANVIEIKSGEINKNLDTCKYIWSQLIQHGADRNSILINIGGGVIGDMGGFCASTYMRGIRFIQIPTTLLSQVDASVGGKLGIDFQNLKNIIGQFNDPIAVFMDQVFYKTLDQRQLHSGFAEILKHALIKDVNHWESIKQIKSLKDFSEWNSIVHHSVNIKKEVVESDPFEKGLRKILNFGHSIGHAVESIYLNSPQAYLHGEAIAIGMICEAYLSHQKLALDHKYLEEIIEVIHKWFKLRHIPSQNLDAIVDRLKKDKKNEDGVFLFSLLPQIGNCEYNVACTSEEVEQAIHWYNQSFS